jgi:hypothetical protein
MGFSSSGKSIKAGSIRSKVRAIRRVFGHIFGCFAHARLIYILPARSLCHHINLIRAYLHVQVFVSLKRLSRAWLWCAKEARTLRMQVAPLRTGTRSDVARRSASLCIVASSKQPAWREDPLGWNQNQNKCKITPCAIVGSLMIARKYDYHYHSLRIYSKFSNGSRRSWMWQYLRVDSPRKLVYS